MPPVGIGLQADVDHPLQRHVAGAVGVRRAVAAAEVLERGHGPVGLVADEDAVLDDVPVLAGDALVVPADVASPQSVSRSPVTFMTGEPYWNVPSLSKVANDVPAYAAS